MANPVEFLQNVGGAGGGIGADSTPESFPILIGKIIGVFLTLLGAIFLILIIYGGFKWMTAGGDSENIKKAQQIIRNAVIGLAIVLMANVITQFVLVKIFAAVLGS